MHKQYCKTTVKESTLNFISGSKYCFNWEFVQFLIPTTQLITFSYMILIFRWPHTHSAMIQQWFKKFASEEREKLIQNTLLWPEAWRTHNLIINFQNQCTHILSSITDNFFNESFYWNEMHEMHNESILLTLMTNLLDAMICQCKLVL